MRSIIILLLLSLVSYGKGVAQSMLKVSTADKQAINVAVDGRYFNKRGTSVTVGDLPPGRHVLQIYGVVRKRNGKLREAVIYEGPLHTYVGMICIFVYDPATDRIDVQEIKLDEYRKNNPLPPGMPTQDAPGNQYDNVNNAASNNADNGTYTEDTNAAVASPVTVADPSTLTDDRQNEIKKLADAKKTDTEKMKVLKEQLANEKIITDQVAFMMDLLNFESSKLDFAKWAYSITADTDNFRSLDVKFTYKSYQDDFIKFVASQQ